MKIRILSQEQKGKVWREEYEKKEFELNLRGKELEK